MGCVLKLPRRNSTRSGDYSAPVHKVFTYSLCNVQWPIYCISEIHKHTATGIFLLHVVERRRQLPMHAKLSLDTKEDHVDNHNNGQPSTGTCICISLDMTACCTERKRQTITSECHRHATSFVASNKKHNLYFKKV